jgi:phosphatidylglycerol:prolipoprotein diacylglycerol transferase
VEPIPVIIHLGPLSIHTYGIGLALTFAFAAWYLTKRLERAALPTDWVTGFVIKIVVAALVGARAMHVLANLDYYRDHLGEVFSIWHGGLSSFGGLLVAVPVGLISAKKACPQLSTLRGLDLVAPVLLASWAVGRVLGPQLMVAGGGHPSTAWFAMHYAGQVGGRVPVPLIQAAEDALSFAVVLLLERRLERSELATLAGAHPFGAVTALAMVLWGASRSLDEFYLLDGGTNLGSALVITAGVLLIAGGVALGVSTRLRWHQAATQLINEQPNAS